jgi:hypothetical protein
VLAVGSEVDAADLCLRPQGDTSGAAGTQVFAAVFNPLEASVLVFSEHLNGGSEGFVLELQKGSFHYLCGKVEILKV